MVPLIRFKLYVFRLRCSIDSLTLTATNACLPAQQRLYFNEFSETAVDDLVAAAEHFVHAVSTVEERLHASYYFYLLISSLLFVPFGKIVYADMQTGVRVVSSPVLTAGCQASTSTALRWFW